MSQLLSVVTQKQGNEALTILFTLQLDVWTTKRWVADPNPRGRIFWSRRLAVEYIVLGSYFYFFIFSLLMTQRVV